MRTIYECCSRYGDVNRTPFVKHYADTEKSAIEWLEKHGGGLYRNTLHNFQFEVPGLGERDEKHG